ncbi:MAG: TIGR02266 family protein, partial [Deltaproteobacteria bacterium]|nr:TIGR02266 family protein [Deltaproteobacteria bacterium]
MADDKRNHPRAKVLSMTVRYKSATIDDFVEHHSDNVSRGGIFIKTSSPFPPGTLLKFEIRIADDEAVLAGVGRVVWKRDEPGELEDEPAGMGVKFIKLDEKSRALISRLVGAAKGKESKYDRGFAQEAKKKASKKVKKGTLLGLGAIGAEEEAAAKAEAEAEPAKAEPEAAPMFPKTDPEEEMPPPEERTVMKQAAELLEQALAGAGGSMDDLGTAATDDEEDDWGAPEPDKKEEPADKKKDEPEKKEEPADKKEEPEKKEEPADKKEEPKGDKKPVVAAADEPKPKPAAKKKKEPRAAAARPVPKPDDEPEEEEEGGGKTLPILLV